MSYDRIDCQQFKSSGVVSISFGNAAIGLFMEPTKPGVVIELSEDSAKELLLSLLHILNPKSPLLKT